MRLGRRLASLLLALVAVIGLALSASPASADDGWLDDGLAATCRASAGPLGFVDAGAELLTGSSVCSKIGDAGAKKIEKEWQEIKESLLGDVVKSTEDVTKWLLKKTITVSLMGPSVDLAGTGLWGGEPSIAGMMTWLGLVIAALGVIWQLGKMAITGQAKHAGRAMAGWVENMLLSAVGVSMFAMLLVVGDAVTSGVVKLTFENDEKVLERIMAVLLPTGVANPIGLLVLVLVLLIIGGIQMLMIFLRQSAIPIICVLLPVAGAGRTGGDATRKWAPALITSGLVIIAYKPTVAIILCIGFAEFGESSTLAEWLRGCATLLLAVLAPGPLTKIFAPFGAAAGGGMGAGGAVGAVAGAAGYFASKTGGDDSGSSAGGGGGGGEGPADPVAHAGMVNQTMGPQGGGAGDPGDSESSGGGGGDEALTQAARNDAGVPAQGGAPGAEGAAGAGGLTAEAGGTGTAAAGAGTAVGAVPAVGTAIQVIDGVNDTVQGASGAVGGGGER